jgi:hypothetical protein
MKKLSETYKELGIAFSFPIEIRNPSGKETYYEDSEGFWCKCEYDTEGTVTYREDIDGVKLGTPRSQPSERLVTNYDEVQELRGQLAELRKMLSELHEVNAELHEEIAELERGG